jgi:hypothetical protein
MKKAVKRKYLDVLEDIMKNSPPELSGDNLFKTVHAYESTKELLTKAILEDSITEEKKQKIKNILDSGTLDDERYYTKELNMEVARKKEEWVEQELLKYVERGELPKYVGKNITKTIRQRIKHEKSSTGNN